MELQTLFRRERAAETYTITHPLFPDPNNGAASVPESETSLAGS